MLKHWFVAVVAVAAIGCSKDKNKDSASGSNESAIPPGSPECTTAIDHAISAAAAQAKQRAEQRLSDTTLPQEQRERIENGIHRAEKELEQVRASLSHRCTEDKWAPEVITCLNGANDRTSMLSCLGKLPPELKERAEADSRMARGWNRKRGSGEPNEGPGNGMQAAPSGLSTANGSAAAPAAGSAGSSAAPISAAGSAAPASGSAMPSNAAGSAAPKAK
jgi:hypothetical protein